MKIEMPSAKTCPTGLIHECEMLTATPERAKDIIDHAIRVREREKVYNKEIRGMFSLHPFHTTRVALIVGLTTFTILTLLSELAVFGKWYAQLKSYTMNVSIPLVGEQSLNFGGFVPTSTALSVSSAIPTIGLMDALYLSLGVIFAFLVEKIIVASLHVKEVHMLKEYQEELANELAVLQDWRKKY